MNRYLPQNTKEYEHKSNSNLSLITAGLPSGSIMTSQLIPPSSTTRTNQYFNQNRATDTQPISFNFSQSDTDQSITFSHQTKSDTYLNLSRKDIDELLAALHTLAQYVHNDMDNRSHTLTMPYSKSSNHTIKNSSQTNSHVCHHSFNCRCSLSTDLCFNYPRHHHHHNRDQISFNPVEQFQHQPYDMKSKQDHQLLQQLQYYQNNFHHPSNHESNIQPKQTYYYSRPCQSIKNLPSPMSLSSYILDQLISINQNDLIPNVQMLPEHAHSFQIIQNNPIHSFMSIDSLNGKDRLQTILNVCPSQKRKHDQTLNINDQLSLNKIDAATQWSLPISTPVSTISQNIQVPDSRKMNSTILTELSPSKTTIATNNSAIHRSCMSNQSTIKANDENVFTKSETEQFLKSVDLPTYQCLNIKQRTINTTAKYSSINDVDMNISIDDSFPQPLNKKKNKSTPTKVISKRPRYRPLKGPRNPPIKKSSHRQNQSRSNRQLMTIIQSLKTNDLQDDSSFDFFDADTTLSDPYDRFFSDTTTTSEKSIS